jgi:hypothetical protein
VCRHWGWMCSSRRWTMTVLPLGLRRAPRSLFAPGHSTVGSAHARAHRRPSPCCPQTHCSAR